MDILPIVFNIAHQMGISLGVGSSTIAITLFLLTLRDKKMDPSERSALHAVYIILRVAMTLIAIGLAGFAAIYAGQGILENPIYIAEAALFVILVANAILMTLHKMPMWLSAPVQGATWYSFFFVTTLPIGNPTLIMLIAGYLGFLLVFVGVFDILRKALGSSAGDKAPS